jgi:hypothetical protein
MEIRVKDLTMIRQTLTLVRIGPGPLYWPSWCPCCGSTADTNKAVIRTEYGEWSEPRPALGVPGTVRTVDVFTRRTAVPACSSCSKHDDISSRTEILLVLPWWAAVALFGWIIDAGFESLGLLLVVYWFVLAVVTALLLFCVAHAIVGTIKRRFVKPQCTGFFERWAVSVSDPRDTLEVTFTNPSYAEEFITLNKDHITSVRTREVDAPSVNDSFMVEARLKLHRVLGRSKDPVTRTLDLE